MKKTGVFLLAIVLVFTMYACNTDGPVSPTDGTDTAPFSPPLNTAPPEAAEPALLWDSALYESILEEARTDFSEALDASYYLLYDITQDGIPELMLKQDDGILRIFTQQKQQNVLLGEFDATRGVPCGYHHGDGLLLCQTSWQCVDYLVLITWQNGKLQAETILDHPEMGNFSSFQALPLWKLSDPAGLLWEANPKDNNVAQVDIIRREEQLRHTDLMEDLSTEDVRRLNLFLSSFAQLDLTTYPTYEYDLLEFVYAHCAHKQADSISYADGYTYITLDDANLVLNAYFGITLEPGSDPVSYTDPIQNRQILLQNGNLRYTPVDPEPRNYVTVAEAVYENSDGSYTVYFHTYRVENATLDPYYELRFEDVANHPEMEFEFWGSANIKDFVVSGGVPSYQLLSYNIYDH